MDTPYTWTIDVETDFGGRADEWSGVEKGIPLILDLFKKHNVKALFFLSTELIEDFSGTLTPKPFFIMKKVMEAGHQIGSHGHFHHYYSSKQRLFEDRRLSDSILENSLNVSNPEYRAPKFDKRTWNLSTPYSDPKNHLSLLKMMWLGLKPNKDTILYLHPFDIVGGNNPPTLFCRMWYSRPEKALHLLNNLLVKYEGSNRLK